MEQVGIKVNLSEVLDFPEKFNPKFTQTCKITEWNLKFTDE